MSSSEEACVAGRGVAKQPSAEFSAGQLVVPPSLGSRGTWESMMVAAHRGSNLLSVAG